MCTALDIVSKLPNRDIFNKVKNNNYLIVGVVWWYAHVSEPQVLVSILCRQNFLFFLWMETCCTWNHSPNSGVTAPNVPNLRALLAANRVKACRLFFFSKRINSERKSALIKVLLKEKKSLVVVWRRPIDAAVRTFSAFHQLGATTKKSLDACLPCAMGDDGTGGAVLEDRRKRGTVQGVINALR